MKSWLITFLANYSTKKTSVLNKAISLTIGAIIFLVLFPAIFLQFGIFVEKYVMFHWNGFLEQLLTIIAISLGLVILLWTAITQWVIGDGTPAPNALMEVSYYEKCII